MSSAKVSISPFIIVGFMLISVLSPFANFATAGSGQGIITAFADGNNSASVLLDGGITNSDVAIEFERNSTIVNAVFDISYDTSSSSPGVVTLDISEDGQYEWAWDGQGYGNLGEQTKFSNDASSSSATVNSSGNILADIFLPSNAQIQYAEMYAEYSPDYGGGFVATGAIDSLAVGDVDSDGLPEPIFLQRAHTWLNGTTSPAVGTYDWNVSAGFSNITWQSICDGASSIEVADFNGDSMVDVAGLDQANGSACLLISLANGSWASNTNLTLGVGASGIGSGDMDGDGDAEIISIHGDGNLREFIFNNQNGSFGLGASTIVSANSTTMPATLGGLAIGQFWGNGSDTVAVSDSMDGHVTMWNSSSGSWIPSAPGLSFDCIQDSMIPLDWNGDGFLDLLGNANLGSVCTATFNGTGWSTNLTSFTSLNNYVVGDWNGNGSSDLIQSVSGTNDGNDSTHTGYLEVKPFGVNGSVEAASSTMFAHTHPSEILLADMDGDGLSEHLVVAGESSVGLFIAGWHEVSLDFDSDNNPEGYMIGFAGDGQSGVEKLNWTDVGNISATLMQTYSGISGQFDVFGTEISTLRPMGFSVGDGTISLSQMNITYDVTIQIDSNPSMGNLSNVFNSMMLPGAGNFNVSLPINSTSPGILTLDSVSIEWVDGMANQVYRDAPVFLDQWVFWDSAENQHVVMLFWDNFSVTYPDLLSYQLYRWENGASSNINTPYETMIPDNRTFDMNQVSGKTWDYVVRAVFQNGIYSNYSNVITVNVPSAEATDEEAPAAVASVTAVDVPNDEGGMIVVNWDVSISSDVEWYAIYVDTSQISDVTGMVEVANYSVYEGVYSFNYSTPSDGVDYYFGVICGDLAGNVNWTVTNSAATFSQNNSLRSTSMSLQVVTDGSGGDIVATAGNPLSISGQINSMGEAVSFASYSVDIDAGTPFSVINLNGVTDVNGTFSHQWSDWLDFENEHGVLVGAISIDATYVGGVWGADSQPLAGSSASESILATTSAMLSVTPALLQLDSNGQGIVTISLTADNTLEQSLLNQITIDYQIGNETNQAIGDSGTLGLTAGTVDLGINYPIGGELDISLSTIPSWLVLPSSSARVILFPPPLSDGPGDNGSETTELIPVNWSCEGSLWEVVENGTMVSNTCIVGNPNDMLAHIEMAIVGPTGLEVMAVPTSASIFADSSKEIQISLTAPLGMAAGNYSLDVEIDMTAAGYNDSQVSETIDITVIAEATNNGGNNGGQNQPPANNNPESSGMSPTLLGIIAVVIIALAAVGFVVLRRISSSDEFDEDDEWEGEYDDDDDYEEEAPIRRKPKVLHSAAALQSMNDDYDDYEEPEVQEEAYDDAFDEEDYTQSDDYHMDDDGTEWWKDELGVWWYRYSDEEEWSEFIE
jgi:hypothetical protein